MFFATVSIDHPALAASSGTVAPLFAISVQAMPDKELQSDVLLCLIRHDADLRVKLKIRKFRANRLE